MEQDQKPKLREEHVAYCPCSRGVNGQTQRITVLIPDNPSDRREYQCSLGSTPERCSVLNLYCLLEDQRLRDLKAAEGLSRLLPKDPF